MFQVILSETKKAPCEVLVALLVIVKKIVSTFKLLSAKRVQLKVMVNRHDCDGKTVRLACPGKQCVSPVFFPAH